MTELSISEKRNHVGQLEQTDDGSLTLVHHEHGESYHSSAGALREASELYIGGSRIQSTFATGRDLAVLDVGLGLGYNALATIQAWGESDQPGNLILVSLESNFELIRQLISGQGEWQKNWNSNWFQWTRTLTKHSDQPLWSGLIQHPNASSTVVWTVFGGSALDSIWSNWVSANNIRFNFIWQDAFSPKVCPELWTTEWFSVLRGVAAKDCCMMTYSVARKVRDHLTAGAWKPEKIPGTGTKRHWLTASVAED